MRKLMMLLGAIALMGAAQTPPAFVPKGGAPVHEQRWLYNTVKVRHDLNAVCDGHTPQRVRSKHTGGDIAAAIVSLGIWTPVHLYVMC